MPHTLRISGMTYAVIDVVKQSASVINEEEDEASHSYSILESTSNSLIGDRMIAQFFNEVEGPDREWEPYFKDEVFLQTEFISD